MPVSYYMISDSQVEQTRGQSCRLSTEFQHANAVSSSQGGDSSFRIFRVPQMMKDSTYHKELPPTLKSPVSSERCRPPDFASWFTVLPIQRGHRHLIVEMNAI